MFCGTLVFVVILGISISTSTSSAAPLHEDKDVHGNAIHYLRTAETKGGNPERSPIDYDYYLARFRTTTEMTDTSGLSSSLFLDQTSFPAMTLTTKITDLDTPADPVVAEGVNKTMTMTTTTTTSDKENENENEHEVEPTGEKPEEKEAYEIIAMNTPEEQNYEDWAEEEPEILTSRVSDFEFFFRSKKREQEKPESEGSAGRMSAVEVSRLHALLKSLRTEKFGTMISHPRASVHGVIENEGGAFYYNLRGELNPGCMALDGTNLSVTSIDNLYTCVRLFSSPDCKGETRAYYPGNSELPILPNARSVGPCFDNELDETSSKYVQHGIILVKEFTKIETSPGSNQFTTPDVQNIL